MRGTNSWRKEAWGPACQAQIVAMAIYAGGPKFQVNALVRPAFTLLGAVFQRHGYIVRRIGGYNCRKITGGTAYSSHAWAISADINDDTNPYRRDKLVTDMPRAMMLDGYKIKTAVTGTQVFRNGGDWDGRPETPHSNYDAMHWECIATPEELAEGFTIPVPKKPALSDWPVIRRGATGPIVLHLQKLLKMNNTSGQGVFGPRTEQEVKRYQLAHGLVADGIVGAGTWTALLTRQPSLADGGVSPQKLPIIPGVIV